MNTATLAAFLLLLPFTAFANPNVGDTSVYDLETDIRGQTLKGEYTITVSAVNRAADTITQTVRVKFAGPESKQTLTLKLSQYEKDTATRADRVEHCAQNGGVPEQVTTPAGQFNTCKMPVETQDVHGFQWIANIPSGFVKYISKSGDTTTTQILRAFHTGR